MKKKFMLLFSLGLMIISLGTVYAGTYIYTATTYIDNTISGNKVNNTPLSLKKDMGRYFNTHIKNVTSVSNLNGGSNASGGVRVFTSVERKNNILWTFNDEKMDAIYPGTTSSFEQFWNTQQSGTKSTTVEWQNRTGNTIVNATFDVEQL